MRIPLEITFREVPKTESLEDLIREKADKLDRICDYLMSCRIVVEKPHEHQRWGQPFDVRIEMQVPPGHNLIVKRKSTGGNMHDELPVILREAFNVAQRRLKKLMEQQRGETKTHPEQETTAFVNRLFHEQGYGFLKTLDGREIYFHKNSVIHDDFDRLDIGMGVRFVEVAGEEGPQASTVQIMDSTESG